MCIYVIEGLTHTEVPMRNLNKWSDPKARYLLGGEEGAAKPVPLPKESFSQSRNMNYLMTEVKKAKQAHHEFAELDEDGRMRFNLHASYRKKLPEKLSPISYDFVEMLEEKEMTPHTS